MVNAKIQQLKRELAFERGKVTEYSYNLLKQLNEALEEENLHLMDVNFHLMKIGENEKEAKR